MRTAERKRQVKNFLVAASCAMIVLTFVKIVAIVFANPLMGYANNYDFIRQSSCVGLWQNYSDRSRYASNHETPVNPLLFDGHKRKNVCMVSSDNIFPLIATGFRELFDLIDFREISFWKVTATLLLFALLFFMIKGWLSRLALSLSFFLVFGDIANLLYANTLYLDYSVILGIFFASFSSIYLASSRYKNVNISVLAAISIIWLGFSKQQYMPLAVLFGVICSVVLWVRFEKRRLAVLFALMSMVIPFAYGQWNNSEYGHNRLVSFANKTNAILGAVLPEASDKEAALAKLGLPESCLEAVGIDWFHPGAEGSRLCPEVENASRVKLLGIFFDDPSTFLEPMRKAAIGIHPFYPYYLGHIEYAGQGNSAGYLILRNTSLSYVLAKIPKGWIPFLVLGSTLLGFVALMLTGCPVAAQYEIQPFLMMICFGAIIMLYSILSSVFGDGYIELQKHAVGFLVGVAFQITGLLLLAAGLLLNRFFVWKIRGDARP